jgi:site-specific DNA-methyltransferase (adenine-specific)
MTWQRSDARQPDILEVIADLSNDEVRTPPRIADAMLDLLPDKVWSDPTLRWLDPGCKTGIFPRQITRRLVDGLADVIPDRQARLDHILREQIFAIAITTLTAMMSRRTVYCSKDASSEYSVVRMPNPDGNIWFDRVEHSYDTEGRCSECGAISSQVEVFSSRDNYAYALIHEGGRTALVKDLDMNFDVVVGNPPYQMDDIGGHRPVPLYNHFVEQAIELDPSYILFITPSRWMAGGLGLSSYRQKMLGDDRLRALVDYPVASEVFPGVEIKGGVSYFLWDREHSGECDVTTVRGGEPYGPVPRHLGQHDVFVRDARALAILERVVAARDEAFEEVVASVRPFGNRLRSNFQNYSKLQSAGDRIPLYMNEGAKRRKYWVSEAFVENNQALADAWKIYLPKAGSDGGKKLPDVVIGKPFVGEPGSVCTETYLAIGPFGTEDEATSAFAYLTTRFARFLISLRKPGQDTIPSTFRWVPKQSWDREWTDEELFAKYGITEDEQAYIVEMIKDMPS